MKTPRNDIQTKWVIRGFILGLTILYLVAFPIPVRPVGQFCNCIKCASCGCSRLVPRIDSRNLCQPACHPDQCDSDCPPGRDEREHSRTRGIPACGHHAFNGRCRLRAAARFFAEAKRIENELRSREQFLAKLNDIAASILTAQGPEQVIQKLTRDLAILLNANDCYITRWDTTIGQAVPVSSSVQPATASDDLKFEIRGNRPESGCVEGWACDRSGRYLHFSAG